MEAYGGEAASRQHVAKWCHSFTSGRQVVENRNMVENVRSSFSGHELKTDSDEENKMNNAGTPPSSEIGTVMISIRSYLGAHSKDEMNNKMDNIE
ncbi:hypothetical protein TNCV_908751 [Trichonephila clavipes]|nr:hypothetical protein TNCV_908751 [Trichonephila clavipes]